ncbi:2-C-methyl-D-erythritol 4-phosphate cytidylyltransferase [Actinomyces sp. MRS3W]|uniref:IspD/TarI family cytidylyltransferase n=1 Tax=Actinomyces sp. MRS3W TaxID=2800796 RepID=UPI0028FD4B2A|nr:2-C-methyl-D-erythritol 4-phosphate cytidylyltransferase [Actinomyces sp. MRS3W]MDU0347954.1 2-C-methyl-D-erythritol 4-phosphate cytidylyltransferase [Actinomyces sp. MRS3W]
MPDRNNTELTEGGGSTVAVLTAAGSGMRLGADGPKALVELAGQSLLRRAARGLLASGVIDHITVTAPVAEVDRFTAEVSDLAGPGRIAVVAGSPASRQASVALGLAAALDSRPDAEVILVHDAVVPGLPVTDTIKEVALEGDGRVAGASPVERVVGTPQRDRLRAVQTPQGFARPTLEAAHARGAADAVDEAHSARDDAALVEAMGGRVVVVPGDPLALKVTTPLDLALAETLARREPAAP